MSKDQGLLSIMLFILEKNCHHYRKKYKLGSWYRFNQLISKIKNKEYFSLHSLVKKIQNPIIRTRLGFKEIPCHVSIIMYNAKTLNFFVNYVKSSLVD